LQNKSDRGYCCKCVAEASEQTRLHIGKASILQSPPQGFPVKIDAFTDKAALFVNSENFQFGALDHLIPALYSAFICSNTRATFMQSCAAHDAQHVFKMDQTEIETRLFHGAFF